jgi:hypothetical protein
VTSGMPVTIGCRDGPSPMAERSTFYAGWRLDVMFSYPPSSNWERPIGQASGFIVIPQQLGEGRVRSMPANPKERYFWKLLVIIAS